MTSPDEGLILASNEVDRGSANGAIHQVNDRVFTLTGSLAGKTYQPGYLGRHRICHPQPPRAEDSDDSAVESVAPETSTTSKMKSAEEPDEAPDDLRGAVSEQKSSGS